METKSVGKDRYFEQFVQCMPEPLHDRIRRHAHYLVDVCLDLGRPAVVRLTGGSLIEIEDHIVSKSELEQVAAKLTNFNEKDRAGIDGTLHRISAIRNQSKEIIGLTCRFGRLEGSSLGLVRHILDKRVLEATKGNRASLLILGGPGTGKTTLLRQIAWYLAESRKLSVIIVDGSSEIGGQGDIPHPAVGKARRMPIYPGKTQTDILIDAVQNHTPDVIIVDELGTIDETGAAKTIAERGVVLIATAHSSSLEDALKNPFLLPVLGNVTTSTIGDREASKLKEFRKTKIERVSPPTFDICVQLEGGFNRARVHKDVTGSIDAIYQGKTPDTFVTTNGVFN